MPKAVGAFPLVGPKDSYEKTIAPNRGVYKAPEAFATTASHLYTPKSPIVDCAHCFRVATLMCTKCNKTFCFTCWTLVPHHQLTDVADMMITASKSVTYEQSGTITAENLSPVSVKGMPPTHNSPIEQYQVNLPAFTLSKSADIDEDMRKSFGSGIPAGSQSMISEGQIPHFSSSLEVSNYSDSEHRKTALRNVLSPPKISGSPEAKPASSKCSSRTNSPTFQNLHVGAPDECLTSVSNEFITEGDLQAAVDSVNLTTAGRAKSPISNDLSAAQARDLKPITAEFAFIDDKGRIIPRLERPCSSLTAAGCFRGFMAQRTGYKRSLSPVNNALTGNHNFASTWAELDLFKSSFITETDMNRLSPAGRWKIREAEIERIGSQAVIAADRIRMAKKYNDITAVDQKHALDVKLRRRRERNDLASTN